MVDWLGHLLHGSAVLRLFIVIGLGYLLGELKFPGNFRLGLAAVLFVGLGCSALDPKFVLPGDVQTIGLVLFVYCIGLEAAPGFLHSLRSDGLRLTIALTVSVLLAALGIFVLIKFTSFPREMLVGLFCGALTSTPALGAASEAILRGGNPGAVNAAVVGYGMIYPFALLSMLLLLQIRTAKASPRELEAPPNTLPRAQTIKVQSTHGAEPWRAGEVEARTGVVMTRLREPSGAINLVRSESLLAPGVQAVAVGSPQNIQQAISLLGSISAESIEKNLEGFETHRYFVSNPAVVGRTLKQLELDRLGAVLSRIRRADVDLPVNDETVLHLGDRVRVITYKENEAAVRRFFGNSLTALSETGYFSFALGIALGLVLGEIPVPVPGLAEPVRIGLAAGPLLVALVLGSLGRTGPFIWNPPVTISLTLKQLGILFFLAGAGVKAGATLPQTFREQGPGLIAIGVIITVLTTLLFWALLPRSVRLARVLGATAGLQTQAAALSFATRKVPPGPVNLAYATVYPAAVILKVLLVQLLLALP